MRSASSLVSNDSDGGPLSHTSGYHVGSCNVDVPGELPINDGNTTTLRISGSGQDLLLARSTNLVGDERTFFCYAGFARNASHKRVITDALALFVNSEGPKSG